MFGKKVSQWAPPPASHSPGLCPVHVLSVLRGLGGPVLAHHHTLALCPNLRVWTALDGPY